MEWLTRYQPHRDRYWPEVEHYFGELPAYLFRQALLLRHNLASAYSDTGQFEHILCRQRDYPLFYLHCWLLDDWHFPPGEARAELEKHLFLASVFTFAAIYTRESILDPDTAFDQRYALLENTLHQRAVQHLAQLFPAASSFWDYYRRLRGECANAISKFHPSTSSGRSRKAEPFMEADLLELGRQLAFAKIPLAAIALQSDRVHQLPQLFLLLDHWHVIFQILRQIKTLQRDLRRRGQPTYVIARVMLEAGIDLDQPASPERILGALLLTGSVQKIGQECLARLEVCRTLARELNLETFNAYNAGVEENIRELMALFSLAPKSQEQGPRAKDQGSREKIPNPRRSLERSEGDNYQIPSHQQPATNYQPPDARRSPKWNEGDSPQPPAPNPITFTPWRDNLAQAIQMAEAYLLADRTFQESWEVQRRGVFNTPELVAKGFTPGLIVEILCQHRTDLSQPVDEIFQTIAANGFKYYPHPSLPPDADDVGLLLRLYQYSARLEEHRALLQAPLRWMEANVLPSGQIPCWFTRNTDFSTEATPVLLWGNSCSTVEANLLLGLLVYDRAGYWPIIERASVHWLERYLARGLGANAYYTPMYALGAAFELVTQLSTGPGAPKLESLIEQVRGKLLDRLKSEVQRSTHTPQAAAFLTLICLRSAAPVEVAVLFDPDWITALLKTQRYDGSWDEEPLAITPTRGEFASWYASRLATTAFCYHALKTFMNL